jgi:predicted mannosyl-3-phosphoglycerate phosphatase (HAD superfamily)
MAAERALEQVGKLKEESLTLFTRALENISADLCTNLGAVRETFMKGCRDAENLKQEAGKIHTAGNVATPQ